MSYQTITRKSRLEVLIIYHGTPEEGGDWSHDIRSGTPGQIIDALGVFSNMSNPEERARIKVHLRRRGQSLKFDERLMSNLAFGVVNEIELEVIEQP